MIQFRKKSALIDDRFKKECKKYLSRLLISWGFNSLRIVFLSHICQLVCIFAANSIYRCFFYYWLKLKERLRMEWGLLFFRHFLRRVDLGIRRNIDILLTLLDHGFVFLVYSLMIFIDLSQCSTCWILSTSHRLRTTTHLQN